MLKPRATWSDVFTPTRRAKTHGGWKTTLADKITWHGILNGRVVCVVSTVRLIEGGMAHFTVSSNARIGENAWNLHGGHFVDLAVSSRHPLTEADLRSIGELALSDVIDGQLDADSLRHRMEAIRQANEQSVDSGSAKETFRRLLQKGESEAATKAFESPDTYSLPPGNTNWRLSNAISWIAGQTNDAERKLDLMKIAGEALPKAS